MKTISISDLDQDREKNVANDGNSSPLDQQASTEDKSKAQDSHMDVSALMDLLDKNKQTAQSHETPDNRLGLSVSDESEVKNAPEQGKIIKAVSQEEKLRQIRSANNGNNAGNDDMIRALKHGIHNNRSTKKSSLVRVSMIVLLLAVIAGLVVGMVYFINKQTQSWSNDPVVAEEKVREPSKTAPVIAPIEPLEGKEKEELLDIISKH